MKARLDISSELLYILVRSYEGSSKRFSPSVRGSHYPTVDVSSGFQSLVRRGDDNPLHPVQELLILIKIRQAVSGSVQIHSGGFPGGFAGLVRSSSQVALAEQKSSARPIPQK